MLYFALYDSAHKLAFGDRDYIHYIYIIYIYIHIYYIYMYGNLGNFFFSVVHTFTLVVRYYANFLLATFI